MRGGSAACEHRKINILANVALLYKVGTIALRALFSPADPSIAEPKALGLNHLDQLHAQPRRTAITSKSIY